MNEFINVGLEREAPGRFCRTPAQVQIMLIVTEALQNGAGQSFGCRGISRSKMTAYSIGEPFRNAPNGKSCSRQAFQTGLYANHTERFGPHAWDNQ